MLDPLKLIKCIIRMLELDGYAMLYAVSLLSIDKSLCVFNVYYDVDNLFGSTI